MSKIRDHAVMALKYRQSKRRKEVDASAIVISRLNLLIVVQRVLVLKDARCSSPTFRLWYCTGSEIFMGRLVREGLREALRCCESYPTDQTTVSEH